MHQRFQQSLQKILAILVVIAVALSSTPVAAAAWWQTAEGTDPTSSDYTYGDCSRIDKEQLRSEIEQITQSVLSDKASSLNIDEVVGRQWQLLRVDVTIQSEVERAVNRVANEEDYFSRLWSGWNADKAQEFAKRIADDAFGGDAFKNKLDELSTAIAGEIAADIEADFARAASAAFLCMKAYVGEKYSATLFTAFENKVSLEVQSTPITVTGNVNVSPLDVHQKALGGIGVLIVTEIARRLIVQLGEQIAERIAGQIVERILGRLGSELIPVIGWVIGIGLIAWDLWEGGKGALPQIQDSLQSEEIKAKIRDEIADAIKKELPQEISLVALEIAVSTVEEWDKFCEHNQDVCQIAGQNPDFKAILSNTSLDQLEQLSALITTFTEHIGRGELDKSIATGQFEQLLALPPATLEILQATQSVSATLAWADIASGRLGKVAEFGLYARHQPADFDAELLNKVLDLDDGAVISKLATLSPAELRTLVNFAGDNFDLMAQQMALPDIQLLVAYLSQPPTTPAANQAGGSGDNATTPTAIPREQLASDLALGRITVDQIVHPEKYALPTTSEPIATTATLPASFGGLSNSVVIATGLLVVLAITALGVGLLRRRAPDAPSRPTEAPAGPRVIIPGRDKKSNEDE